MGASTLNQSKNCEFLKKKSYFLSKCFWLKQTNKFNRVLKLAYTKWFWHCWLTNQVLIQSAGSRLEHDLPEYTASWTASKTRVLFVLSQNFTLKQKHFKSKFLCMKWTGFQQHQNLTIRLPRNVWYNSFFLFC